MIPPDWSVASMSDFFTRAMKRQLHDRATWRSESRTWLVQMPMRSSQHFASSVIKAISAGQNSAIAEEYARTVGTQPPRVKLRPADSPSGYTLPDEGSIAATEYGSMHEKSPIHRPQHIVGQGEKEVQVKTETSIQQSPAVLEFPRSLDGPDLPSDRSN